MGEKISVELEDLKELLDMANPVGSSEEKVWVKLSEQVEQFERSE